LLPSNKQPHAQNAAYDIHYYRFASKITQANVARQRHERMRVKDRLPELGATVFVSSSAVFSKCIADDIDKWSNVIRAANITPKYCPRFPWRSATGPIVLQNYFRHLGAKERFKIALPTAT
jgi:hypothetical protein